MDVFDRLPVTTAIKLVYNGVIPPDLNWKRRCSHLSHNNVKNECVELNDKQYIDFL